MELTVVNFKEDVETYLYLITKISKLFSVSISMVKDCKCEKLKITAVYGEPNNLNLSKNYLIALLCPQDAFCQIFDFDPIHNVAVMKNLEMIEGNTGALIKGEDGSLFIYGTSDEVISSALSFLEELLFNLSNLHVFSDEPFQNYPTTNSSLNAGNNIDVNNIDASNDLSNRPEINEASKTCYGIDSNKGLDQETIPVVYEVLDNTIVNNQDSSCYMEVDCEEENIPFIEIIQTANNSVEVIDILSSDNEDKAKSVKKKKKKKKKSKNKVSNMETDQNEVPMSNNIISKSPRAKSTLSKIYTTYSSPPSIQEISVKNLNISDKLKKNDKLYNGFIDSLNNDSNLINVLENQSKNSKKNVYNNANPQEIKEISKTQKPTPHNDTTNLAIAPSLPSTSRIAHLPLASSNQALAINSARPIVPFKSTTKNYVLNSRSNIPSKNGIHSNKEPSIAYHMSSTKSTFQCPISNYNKNTFLTAPSSYNQNVLLTNQPNYNNNSNISTNPSNHNNNILPTNHSNYNKNVLSTNTFNYNKNTLSSTIAIYNKSTLSSTTSTYNLNTSANSNSSFRSNNSNLRSIIVDGSNVAMQHGLNKTFSCKGIQLVVDYFASRGHKVTVFVPQWRRASSNHDVPHTDIDILDHLFKLGQLAFTPSRRVGSKLITSYDDRYILKLANDENGVVISNDQYQDLYEEECFRDTIHKRLLQVTFIGDKVMFPDDPLGRHGPDLHLFLTKNWNMGCVPNPTPKRSRSKHIRK